MSFSILKSLVHKLHVSNYSRVRLFSPSPCKVLLVNLEKYTNSLRIVPQDNIKDIIFPRCLRFLLLKIIAALFSLVITFSLLQLCFLSTFRRTGFLFFFWASEIGWPLEDVFRVIELKRFSRCLRLNVSSKSSRVDDGIPSPVTLTFRFVCNYVVKNKAIILANEGLFFIVFIFHKTTLQCSSFMLLREIFIMCFDSSVLLLI